MVKGDRVNNRGLGVSSGVPSPGFPLTPACIQRGIPAPKPSVPQGNVREVCLCTELKDQPFQKTLWI